MLVYGVFEIPRYMDEARVVDSVWTTEQEATSRAATRSIGIHGQVQVCSWRLGVTNSRQLLHSFVDGESLSTSG